jgi:hypothetical protein
MSQHRFLTIAGTLVMLFSCPRDGTAGIIEIIAEMSGPKMYGIAGDCRLDLTGVWQSCKASTMRRTVGMLVEERHDARIWLSLGGGFYWSAKKTVNGLPYERSEVKMITFDPMLEIESKSWAVPHSTVRLQLYHGVVGASYNFLYGDGVPNKFSNVGFKVRPFGIVIPIAGDFAFDFSYDLRVYPTRFTAEDFGRTALVPEGNGAELVHAFVFGARVRLP